MKDKGIQGEPNASIECYTLSDVADLLGVSIRTIEREIAQGRIGSMKVRGRRLVRWSQIETYLRKLEAESLGRGRPGRPRRK